MAGTTGLGTTYSLPNYTGELIGLTPEETPFLSAIGGLSGGKQTTSTEFEWQTYDLGTPGQNSAVHVEGDTAPTAKHRVRGNVTNVVQVQQEKVSVSYSKLAAYGQKAGSNNALPNPVQDEANWQVQQAIKGMALDVNYSLLLGSYNKPSDNSDKRKTRGLLNAITTNVSAKGSTVSDLSAATDTVTETSTALSNGDKIIFTDVGASTAIVANKTYYVVSKSTNAFKVAATSGGSAITIGTATVSYRVPWTTTLTTTHVLDGMQLVWDNGGLTGGAATLIVNSSQKRALTAAFADAYGKFTEMSRTVGGVAVDTILTDFGTVNVMLERLVPQDVIVIATLGECAPVFLEVPDKGHFFAEPLAKTGASDDVQLYGEVGLEYGAQTHHGLITGLKLL